MAEGRVLSCTAKKKKKKDFFLVFPFVLRGWNEQMQDTLMLPREGTMSDATQRHHVLTFCVKQHMFLTPGNPTSVDVKCKRCA